MNELIDRLDALNVVTIVFVIAAVTGALVTVFNPDALSFGVYLEKIAIFGAGLGIGRGVASAGRANGYTLIEGEPEPFVPGPGDRRA
jgi:hypothetical protein